MKNEVVYDLHFLEPKFDTKYVAVDCIFTSSLTLENCLLLKTPELAKYCGKRFIGLWMDYLLPIKENNQENKNAYIPAIGQLSNHATVLMEEQRVKHQFQITISIK